jgi:hypothetical protein
VTLVVIAEYRAARAAETNFDARLDTPRFERWLRGEVLPRLTGRRVRKLARLGEASKITEESDA